MVRVIEAVYEDGVLKPLADPGLQERQRVVIKIQDPTEAISGSSLEEWQRVYEGLSEEDIAEVEATFARPRPPK